MNAVITKSHGDYIYRVKDSDLKQIRFLATYLEGNFDIPYTERLQ